MGHIITYQCTHCNYKEEEIFKGDGLHCETKMFFCRRCKKIQSLSTYQFPERGFHLKEESFLKARETFLKKIKILKKIRGNIVGRLIYKFLKYKLYREYEWDKKYILNKAACGQRIIPKCHQCKQSDELEPWDEIHCPKCGSEMVSKFVGLWD